MTKIKANRFYLPICHNQRLSRSDYSRIEKQLDLMWAVLAVLPVAAALVPRVCGGLAPH